jgi:signal transduction histidine kinase
VRRLGHELRNPLSPIRNAAYILPQLSSDCRVAHIGTRARDAAPGGLGIGLSIVREIAELHDGIVQARSNGIGKGAEFTLRLPPTDVFTSGRCI